MRFSGFVGLVTLGLGLVGMAGCEDAKSPTINAELGWKVGCAAGNTGCTQFKYHSQAVDTMLERDFDVECSVKGDNVSFTIRDPGLDAVKDPPGWPGASIRVENGNATNNACNVTVTDAMEAGQASITMLGTCASSGGSAGCTLKRDPESDATKGWQWVGTLICDKLERNSMPTPNYKLTALDGMTAVRIALANCD